METYKLKLALNPYQAEQLKGTFLNEDSFDTLITSDADGYDLNGNLLFRFRKGVISYELAKLGYMSFKDSIEKTEGRGTASGGSKKRIRKDGTISNITVGNHVESGNVGYMDSSAMVRYCRKTAFAKRYFDKFKAGIPFVERVDELYKELCPLQYSKQIAIAEGTDINYRIGKTSFTTVTVNKNFQTAVHQDSGDFREGFGNLCVYREGSFDGSYFVLPEYRVAIDLHTTDMLFVDVHRWHGNTPFKNESEDYLRISYVMYYRENMIACKKPSEELARVKKEHGSFLRL